MERTWLATAPSVKRLLPDGISTTAKITIAAAATGISHRSHWFHDPLPSSARRGLCAISFLPAVDARIVFLKLGGARKESSGDLSAELKARMFSTSCEQERHPLICCSTSAERTKSNSRSA